MRHRVATFLVAAIGAALPLAAMSAEQARGDAANAAELTPPEILARFDFETGGI